MILPALAILAGLVLLAFAADKFVDGASGLAGSLGVSKLVIGLIVVGFGTSAPELLVSARAALGDSPGISIGNALGSNILNIALVVGVTSIFRALPVQSGVIRREFPFLGVGTLLALVVMLDGELSRFDGILLVTVLIVILGILLRLSRRASSADPAVLQADLAEVGVGDGVSSKSALLWLIVGLAGMMIGSESLVWGAQKIALELGVDPLIVGLTVVAVGTSLPELAASIVSARKGEPDLVIGNVIGSNLFNTLGVLGIPGLIAPCSVPDGVLTRDFPVLVLLTAGFFWASLTPRGKGVVGRREGWLFLAAFVGYQFWLFLERK